MIYQNINKCRLCNSKDLKKILDLKDQPSSNALRSNLKVKEKNIPLSILFCKNCKIVQLSSTANPKYLFNHYVWVTKTSKSARDYAEIFCNRVINKSKTNSFIVEIASNDGTFLKPFKKKKKKVLGVDPAKNIARMAKNDGINTLPYFFNTKCAKKIKKKYGSADVIFARNVIPHVKGILSVIQGIYNLLSNEGTGVIEFHYSKIIQDELHYDSIYHEHLFYFTVNTLISLCKKYGLFAFDADISPISGGSIVLYFTKSKKKISKNLKTLIRKENLNKINTLLKWKSFAKKSIKHSKNFKLKIEKLSQNHNIIGYGASARSSTLLNFCGINSKIIKKIIDKNKLKKNKFTPGSSIKIVSFEDEIKKISKYNLVVILAWNFKKEIIKDLKKNNFKGKFLLPLPNKIKLI